jgi:hypothetical protein
MIIMEIVFIFLIQNLRSLKTNGKIETISKEYVNLA